MSEPNEEGSLNINPQIFEAATHLPQHVDEMEKSYFVAAADFITRELISHLGNAWPEILRVADKNSKNSEKPKTAVAGIGIKFDLTNLELLKVDVDFNVTPWKFKKSSSAEDDLRQIKFDFEHGTAVQIETPDHGTPRESEPRPHETDDLFGGDEKPGGDEDAAGEHISRDAGDEPEPRQQPEGDGLSDVERTALQDAAKEDAQTERQEEEAGSPDGGNPEPEQPQARKTYLREELESEDRASLLEIVATYPGLVLPKGKRTKTGDIVDAILERQA